jgi:hypothetical protein
MEAFAPAMAEYHATVMTATWGHLAPSKNKTYSGHLTFAVGIFGSDNLNPIVLECEFKNRSGEELDSSPWFYDAMMDFMQSLETEAGAVYRFVGTFRNYKFKGTIQRLRLEAAR